MEHREEARLETIKEVTLTVLGPPGGTMEALILDVSGSGMRIRAPRPIPCGAPIKVDAGEMLMLGEVCRCTPEQDAYIIGVQLSQSLTATAELEGLNKALLGEDFSRRLDNARTPAPPAGRTRS